MHRPKRYSPEEVKEIADLLEKKLGVGAAAAPDSPPEKPGKILTFLNKERNLVLAILCLWLLVSIVFAGTTADFLEEVTAMY